MRVDFAGAVPFAIPMRTRFRGITVRETLLLRRADRPDGPWGEFCPFVEYDDDEAGPWLRCALESAGVLGAPWPAPRRATVPVNATVPAVGPLAGLPETGLRDGSLTKTLEAAGRISVGGDQWISTERLDACAAELLGRSIGELFLRAERTSVDIEGRLVERVVSLLDPDRFQFHLTFGHR